MVEAVNLGNRGLERCLVGHGGSLRKNVEICGIRVMSRSLLDVYPTQCSLTAKVWARNRC